MTKTSPSCWANTFISVLYCHATHRITNTRRCQLSNAGICHETGLTRPVSICMFMYHPWKRSVYVALSPWNNKSSPGSLEPSGTTEHQQKWARVLCAARVSWCHLPTCDSPDASGGCGAERCDGVQRFWTGMLWQSWQWTVREARRSGKLLLQGCLGSQRTEDESARMVRLPSLWFVRWDVLRSLNAPNVSLMHDIG